MHLQSLCDWRNVGPTEIYFLIKDQLLEGVPEKDSKALYFTSSMYLDWRDEKGYGLPVLKHYILDTLAS